VLFGNDIDFIAVQIISVRDGFQRLPVLWGSGVESESFSQSGSSDIQRQNSENVFDDSYFQRKRIFFRETQGIFYSKLLYDRLAGDDMSLPLFFGRQRIRAVFCRRFFVPLSVPK
jgi:hypothetical protein